ncbi:Uncharacterized protein TCM_039633 [Theobroma cacao]|uniref:Uncharacterized protein n=1 Tax=Theobroma cacao TaxID=3641 RepID=A0A061GRI2_THECC|nr:Uncharacterized protein TCM_039633 [Theobroma cacao]
MLGVRSDLSFGSLMKLVKNVVGGEDGWFPTGEDSFDDDFDGGLDGWHDDSLEDDWVDNSDILNCNHLEGETEHGGVIDLGDVQCDDPIDNNPIADENKISSP